MAEPAHKFYMERHANGPSRYIGAPSKEINKNQPNSALHPSHDDPKKNRTLKWIYTTFKMREKKQITCPCSDTQQVPSGMKGDSPFHITAGETATGGRK